MAQATLAPPNHANLLLKTSQHSSNYISQGNLMKNIDSFGNLPTTATRNVNGLTVESSPATDLTN